MELGRKYAEELRRNSARDCTKRTNKQGKHMQQMYEETWQQVLRGSLQRTRQERLKEWQAEISKKAHKNGSREVSSKVCEKEARI